MNSLFIFIVAFISSLVITVTLLVKLIPFLKTKKIGQKILEIGPRWHKSKEGTPTMGGIAFIFASVMTALITVFIFKEDFDARNKMIILNLFSYSILNGLIGLIDDVAKMKKSKNEGLTPKMKFLLQSIAAVLFLISLKLTVNLSTELHIPFFNVAIDLGWLYYIFAFLLLCGIVNSVNLTDGVDGLAGSVMLTVGMFISISSLVAIKSPDFILIGATLTGISIGFLLFNLHPAKIFMGDTGSLFLGATTVGFSFFINNPLLVIIYGFVFVVEAMSDILQVAYFKLTKGKRIFKMAPLHHHFEKCGYSEMKIVSIFTLVNALFCFIAYFGLGNI